MALCSNCIPATLMLGWTSIVSALLLFWSSIAFQFTSVAYAFQSNRISVGAAFNFSCSYDSIMYPAPIKLYKKITLGKASSIVLIRQKFRQLHRCSWPKDESTGQLPSTYLFLHLPLFCLPLYTCNLVSESFQLALFCTSLRNNLMIIRSICFICSILLFVRNRRPVAKFVPPVTLVSSLCFI
jgi:hypothetical protein